MRASFKKMLYLIDQVEHILDSLTLSGSLFWCWHNKGTLPCCTPLGQYYHWWEDVLQSWPGKPTQFVRPSHMAPFPCMNILHPSLDEYWVCHFIPNESAKLRTANQYFDGCFLSTVRLKCLCDWPVRKIEQMNPVSCGLAIQTAHKLSMICFTTG